jgi:hypothetical protein
VWTRVFARLAAAIRSRVARATLLLLLVAAGIWLLRRPPAVRQPVAFDHRIHTEQMKLACSLCHPYVQVGMHAGLPGAQTCKMCHQVPQGTSPEAARVTTLLTSGVDFRFNKLFHLPPYVYFSHRRHVGMAKLPCADCHGQIALTTVPPSRPLVTIRMQVCLDCHQTAGQSLDCVACHR